MRQNLKSPIAVASDRTSLRLPASVFRLIDEACMRRPGSVSRNTWIAEAVQEKLQREGINEPNQPGSEH